MRFLPTALAVGALLAGPLSGPALAQARPAVLAPAKPESVGFSSERLAKMDAAMKALVDKGALPGVVTYVARHGRQVHFSAYGKSDLASGAPLKEDTIYRIFSQTKPVTGVAMMILYEEGRWKLDEPVTKYVPEFKDLKVYKGLDAKGEMILEPIARSATMRELMSHTAGFSYGFTDSPVDRAYQKSAPLSSATLHQVILKATDLPLAEQPGESWRYSIAVDIQGYIVEKLSGQSLPDFMQSRIFGPLGMKDTGFWIPEAQRRRLASLYDVNPEKRVVPAPADWSFDVSKPPTAAEGGGGLVSTVADYARFAQMLCNGGELDGVRILSPSTIRLMTANHLTGAQLAKQPLGPGVGFGLDVAVVMDPSAAGATVGRGTFSWNGAAGTWFWVDPENEVVVLGMIQVLGAWDLRLEALSRQLVYSALVDPSK
jgi:CubicO group peptidase (beta-lactamase class C family)